MSCRILDQIVSRLPEDLAPDAEALATISRMIDSHRDGHHGRSGREQQGGAEPPEPVEAVRGGKRYDLALMPYTVCRSYGYSDAEPD